MVEIREESTTRHDGPSAPSGSSPSGDSPSATNSHWRGQSTLARLLLESKRNHLMDFLKSRQTDAILFLTRIVTVLCTFYFVLPFGPRSSQYSAYSKAFAAAAATNALRVHQRVGGLRFTREFLSMVLMEDSCHYLIYSVLFITSTPVTMALMPIFLYGLLHSVNFATQICYAIGKATSVADKISELTRQHTQNLLGIIACSEIFLMPMLVAMVFVGKASFFLPFIYYRFVTLRYVSRRNHSTKLVFYQLRVSLEQAVSSPNCPQMIRNAVHFVISLTCRLCPATIQ
uniref:Transmembrane protein 33 n=1 Tax=Elaeophora elaphi TaxID=1147741 RepID=A0A158Q7K4_9BILA